MRVVQFLAGLVFMAFQLPWGYAADLKELEERVRQLEQRQQEAFEQYHDGNDFVRPFLKHRLLLGGYFETGFTHANGPDMPAQHSMSSHIVGLNLTSNFTNADRFVMQLQSGLGYTASNPHNDPNATAKKREFNAISAPTLLTQGFFEHRFNPLFNVQTGLGYVPFGVAFQQREVVLFKRRNGPSFLRATGKDNVGIAFPLWMGVHMHGSVMQKRNQLGYNAYTFTPTTKPSSVGLGSRLWYRLHEFLTVGVSHQIGETTNSATFQSYGSDLDLKLEDWGLTVEYGRSSVSHGKQGPESYYAMPYYNLVKDRLLIYATADYVKNPNQLTGTTLDPYKLWSIGGGVNWLPLSNVRIRLGYLDHNYVGNNSVKNGQDRDAYTVDLSLGLAF